jgi:hypothetical protein
MPDASVSLGLNASEMYGELKNAEQKFSQGCSRMGSSTDGLIRSNSGLFRSSHRVAAQIHSVSKEMLSGASAGDIFGASLEGMGRALNLSLGTLAGLAIGAVVVTKLYKIREEFRLLQVELKKVHAEASKSGDFQTLSQLQASAKNAEDAIKKLQERITNRSSWTLATVGQAFKDAAVNLFNPKAGLNAPEADVAARNRAQSDQDKIWGSEIDKRRRRSDAGQASLDGAAGYEEKANKLQIAHDEANPAVHELNQAAIELKLAFDQLAKSVSDKHLDRAGMSLKELAGMSPDVVGNDVPYAKWKASQDAKKAMGLEAQGESARANFDPEGAHNLFNQAGAMKEGISDLKPSEKMNADFKGALLVSEGFLATIAANSSKGGVNR